MVASVQRAALLLGVLVGFVVSYVRRDPMYQDDTRESRRMTSFVEWIMFDTEFFFLVLLPRHLRERVHPQP